MQPKREFDVDEAAQNVVNACAIALQRGSVPADINELFDKMEAYRNAKTVADNRREQLRLTKEEAEQERTTKRVFLDAYAAFYEHIAKAEVPNQKAPQ
jgi:hypothetical protein